MHAQFHLHQGGGSRKGIVGRGGGNDDEVDVIGGDAGIGHGPLGGFHGKVGGELALRSDMALLDADPLLDPLIGGLDHSGQFSVGEHLFRQIATDTADNGTRLGHAGYASDSESMAAGAALMGKRVIVSEILSIKLLRPIS